MKGVQLTVKEIKDEKERSGCSLTLVRKNLIFKELMRMIGEIEDLDDVKQVLFEMASRGEF